VSAKKLVARATVLAQKAEDGRRDGTRTAGADAAQGHAQVFGFEHDADTSWREPLLEGDGVSLVNCPFHRLAADYTDLVCGMNQCLLAAFLDVADPDGRTQLRAVLDPAPGRCCVRLVPAATA
jgi:predicted ArsR family transcriptional regulator